MAPMNLFLITFVVFIILLEINLSAGQNTNIIEINRRRLDEEVHQSLSEVNEQKTPIFKSVQGNGGTSFDNKNGPNFQVTGQIRTATGGFIQQVMIFFTVVAFVGNAIFMVNVFFMSR